MLLGLKTEIIYGPVDSRRLGPSLGLNILPPGHKWCSLDCVYCQYGYTKKSTGRESEIPLPTPEEVHQALEQALQLVAGSIAYITFSGNGEATLHPQFPEICQRVIHLRNRFAPQAKTAILSNGTTVGDASIRDALTDLDQRIIKLDAGNPGVFTQYSRPQRPIDLAQIIEGLSKMAEVTIQSLFTKGPGGNYYEEHLNDWIDTIAKFSPQLVQLYSLDRPSPTKTLIKLEEKELRSIQTRLTEARVRSRIYP
jgi:wyosine [tRNA(Phe)-imidazoG37] synthetase (radical SAM superfamily)